jgi:hypothetical protein
MLIWPKVTVETGVKVSLNTKFAAPDPRVGFPCAVVALVAAKEV